MTQSTTQQRLEQGIAEETINNQTTETVITSTVLQLPWAINDATEEELKHVEELVHRFRQSLQESGGDDQIPDEQKLEIFWKHLDEMVNKERMDSRMRTLFNQLYLEQSFAEMQTSSTFDL